MKRTIFGFVLFVYYVFSFIGMGVSQSENDASNFDTPLSQKGAVSFLLHTDKTYTNGGLDYSFTQTLVELPGLATCILQRTLLSVNVFFVWQGDGLNRGFHIEFVELTGPETYYFQFTWDAESGFSDGYMNGIPLRCDGVHFEPWKVKGEATRTRVPIGPNRITDIEILPRYLPREEAIKRVPKKLLDKGKHLLGLGDLPTNVDIRKRKGKQLFTSKLNNEESVKDWILEGPGIIRFEEDKMIMRSETPNPPTRGTGHFNYWCPVSFPESFIAEWEFEPLKSHGLAILFFASKGEHGEDVFDPALPKRDGHYSHYTTGAVLNYHVIYFANLPLYQTGYISTQLRKCNKFMDVALGPIGVKPEASGFQRMRLIKEGAHIQLLANDKVCLDFTDPGDDRFGPVLKDGKIALRQMAITEGAYRNFNVWELIPAN